MYNIAKRELDQIIKRSDLTISISILYPDYYRIGLLAIEFLIKIHIYLFNHGLGRIGYPIHLRA